MKNVKSYEMRKPGMNAIIAKKIWEEGVNRKEVRKQQNMYIN